MDFSIHDANSSDSSLDDDFSFGMNLNHELDNDSDEENLVPEFSSEDFGQVNEKIFIDLEGLNISCDSESSYNKNSNTAIYGSKSMSNEHASLFSRLYRQLNQIFLLAPVFNRNPKSITNEIHVVYSVVCKV